MHQKDFKGWSDKKEIIHERSYPTFFQERGIWWCALGCNIGSEEDGKHENFERPVLVFRKFGKDMLWAIPLTTQKPREGSGKEYHFLCGGIQRTADISQLRLISSKRLLRYMDTISYDDFQEIRKLFRMLA
jgi:mRNA-degrading endonuclease toxin of MazEF toxin-antitoxin module